MDVNSAEGTQLSQPKPITYDEGTGGALQLDEPPYQCVECGKMFAIPARLQRHYRVHTGEKPFMCDFCEKTFSVKENLNVHRRIHTKERPYKCSICSRAFEHSGKLHRHMRTHTGERPHKCEICGKTFVQSGQLVIHMRAHTGEKPYACEYCSKGFTCSKQLKVHLRTHTGEKPYECDICGKTFGYNHVLKMHKMSHLGEKLYKCTLCEEFFSSRKALDRHIKNHEKDHLFEAEEEEEEEDAGAPSSSNETPRKNFLSHTIGNAGRTPKRGGTETRERRLAPADMLNGCPLVEQEGHVSGYTSEDSGRGASPSVDRLSPSSDCRLSSSPGCLPAYPSNLSASSTSTYLPTCPATPASHTGEAPPHIPMVILFTLTGERVACPANLLIRLPENSDRIPPHLLSSLYRKEYEEELKRAAEREAARRLEEENFSASVVQLIEALVGVEQLRRVGYPNCSVDEMMIGMLRFVNKQPCCKASLAPVDRIKVNLRLLLETSLTEDMWDEFGWTGKSIEEIVKAFLKPR